MNRLFSWQCVHCTEFLRECDLSTPVMNRLFYTVPN